MKIFSPNYSGSVASWGEVKLLHAVQRWLGSVSPTSPFGIGYDCAVLPATTHRQLITVDPVIYGQHFDHKVSPGDVGAKLLKRNLSDIAAMGGKPTAAVLALTLDPRTSLTWLEAFYRGLAACARRYGVNIVGGDIAQSDDTVAASLTLLGTVTGSRILTRNGARIGDWIYVTGILGGSLESGHHFRFTPRLSEGAWLARQKSVTAMLDLSDGLAKDIKALTPTGAMPVIEASDLPVRRGFDTRAAVSNGEDYELLFSLAARTNHERFTHNWKQKFPRTKLTRIGRFEIKAKSGKSALNLESYHGFEHLR